MSWKPARDGHISLRDRVRIAGTADGEYAVVGVTTYDVPGEPDESWVEYTLSPDGSDHTVYLCAADAGRWNLFDELPDSTFDEPEWQGVVYKGKTKPPKKVDLLGMAFEASGDDYHYKVKVTEETWHPNGEQTTLSYKARVTDYDDGTAVAGSEASLELWNGGRSISLGRPIDGAVEVMHRT